MNNMTENQPATWKRSAMKMLVGALVGGAAMAAALTVAGSDPLDAMGPSRVALGAVGLVYALMAALVGFGLAAPGAGAKLLNVGDADELREERRGMMRSVITMAAIGIVLNLLALARGPGFAAGPVPPGVAMGLLLMAFSAARLHRGAGGTISTNSTTNWGSKAAAGPFASAGRCSPCGRPLISSAGA